MTLYFQIQFVRVSLLLMQETGLETQPKVGRSILLREGNTMMSQYKNRNMKKRNIRKILN